MTSTNQYIDLENSDIDFIIFQSERTSPISIFKEVFKREISVVSSFGGVEGSLGYYTLVLKLESGQLFYRRTNYVVGPSPQVAAYIHNARILIY